MAELAITVRRETARQKVVKLTKGPDGAPVEENFVMEDEE